MTVAVAVVFVAVVVVVVVVIIVECDLGSLPGGQARKQRMIAALRRVSLLMPFFLLLFPSWAGNRPRSATCTELGGGRQQPASLIDWCIHSLIHARLVFQRNTKQSCRTTLAASAHLLLAQGASDRMGERGAGDAMDCVGVASQIRK